MPQSVDFEYTGFHQFSHTLCPSAPQLLERFDAPGVGGALLVLTEPLAGRGRLRAGVPGRRGVERPAALLLRDPLLPPAQAQQHHHQRLKVSDR